MGYMSLHVHFNTPDLYNTRATSTVVFSPLTIGPASFAIGVTSMFSSLISIGFGVGLIYVLGDVGGNTLRVNVVQRNLPHNP